MIIFLLWHRITDIVLIGRVYLFSHPPSEVGKLDMHKEKGQIGKRQKGRRQLLELSSRQLKSQDDDTLWHQTPEMGAEALIATLDSKKEIKKALRKGIIKRKKLI